ncbi:hypothetical protein Btru_047066 [Bulinus truncatus]|nr:hypothetical protein Btru_047066 [Bulinus truncatus]
MNDSSKTSDSHSLTLISNQLMSAEAKTIFTIVDVVILSEIVSIFGMLTNTVTIVVLVRQGFKRTINISLAGLAVSDFLSLISLACLCVGNNPWLIEADVPFDPIGVFYLTTGWPNTVFARITGWVTAYISLERCLCVAMPLQIKRLLTHSRSFLVIVLIYVGVIAGVCPIYFTTGLQWRPNALRNRTILGLSFIGANREEVKRVALAITNVFSPFTSFGLVIICTAILAAKLTSKAEWRKSVTRQRGKPKSRHEKVNNNQSLESIESGGPCVNGNEKSQLTPPVSKDAKVVKLVVVLSSIYIVSSVPAVVHFVWMILDPQYTVTGQQSNVHIAVAGVTFLFQATNSSVNLFVYLYMSTSFRRDFFKLKLFSTCGAIFRDGNLSKD